VIPRTSVPLWELSHLLLTFDRLRAKPTSPEYLPSIFTVSTQHLDPIYLMFFYYWFSTSNSYWEPLVWLVRKHSKKPYWESIAEGSTKTLSCTILWHIHDSYSSITSVHLLKPPCPHMFIVFKCICSTIRVWHHIEMSIVWFSWCVSECL
jgi:hypothetical protein